MKVLIILALLLSSCVTTVNTKGSINKVHYKLTKSGVYNSAEVEAEANNCPILETELNVDGNKSKVVVTCKTVIKPR